MNTLSNFMLTDTCAACNGARINAEARAVRIKEKSIAELTAMTAPELLQFLNSLVLYRAQPADCNPDHAGTDPQTGTAPKGRAVIPDA